MRDFVVIGIVTWACVLALVSCGPSLRLEEQSAAYFEHCHAAERDPRATLEERVACWEAWLTHWAEGTTKARGVYAKERIVALLHGDDRTAEASIEAAEGQAPPLDGLPETPPAPRHETSRHQGSSACDGLCLPAFQACLDGCDREKMRDCRAACEAERRVCQLACP